MLTDQESKTFQSLMLKHEDVRLSIEEAQEQGERLAHFVEIAIGLPIRDVDDKNLKNYQNQYDTPN